MLHRAIRDELVPPVAPTGDVLRVVGCLALPPQLLGALVVGDVDEDGASALRHRLHGVRVRLPVRVLGDPEGAVLGVHAVDAAIVAHAQPDDVVAIELDLVALTERVRREHHGQVRLAGGRGHAPADVVGAPGLLVPNADEHELLAHEPLGCPAVVGALPQAVGDLAQEGVAPVGRSEVEDHAIVGDRREESLVLARALAETVQVARGVHRPDEELGGWEAVEVVSADAGHAQHLQDDDAVVGELHPNGPAGKRGSGRRHEVGDHVHGLAPHRPSHAADLRSACLAGVSPVVVQAFVRWVVGGHHCALLGARGVLGVGVREVAAAPGLDELTRLQCLGEKPLVGVGVDNLDAVRLQDASPLGDELVDVWVGHSCSGKDLR